MYNNNKSYCNLPLVQNLLEAFSVLVVQYFELAKNDYFSATPISVSFTFVLASMCGQILACRPGLKPD